MIVVSCAIGAYASQNVMFDIWLTLGFGVVGLCLQENQHSVGAVHAGAGARQPRRGCVPAVDDRLRRRHEGVLVERSGRLDHDAGHCAAVLAADRRGIRQRGTAVAAGESFRRRAMKPSPQIDRHHARPPHGVDDGPRSYYRRPDFLSDSDLDEEPELTREVRAGRM
jgi:hypothetical protein